MRGKRKKIVAICLAAMVLAVLAALHLSSESVMVKKVYVAVSDTGNVFMDYEKRPVKLNGKLPDDLVNGDECLVVCSRAFMESFPEQTQVMLALKLKDGSEENVSAETREILRQYG